MILLRDFGCDDLRDLHRLSRLLLYVCRVWLEKKVALIIYYIDYKYFITATESSSVAARVQKKKKDNSLMPGGYYLLR